MSAVSKIMPDQKSLRIEKENLGAEKTKDIPVEKEQHSPECIQKKKIHDVGIGELMKHFSRNWTTDNCFNC
jgi:hypothetical protein